MTKLVTKTIRTTLKQKMLAYSVAIMSIALTACSSVGGAADPAKAKAQTAQITVLYDAFGKDSTLKKDWGFAALVEVGGKRILFDTGNDGETFAHNVKAKGVDLSTIDFVVLSHRHSDHMAGLQRVLDVNPKVKIYAPREGFGIYGSSLPSTFYRKDVTLPSEYRYYDGKPDDVLKFGTAWEKANFQTIDQTSEIAPGVWLIALVSDAVGTKELKELSLAINTPDGVVIVAGCSHPGIENIVAAATKINPKIHYIAGGFHLVNAPDEAITKVVTALHDRFQVENIAPGHCTGEPTFNALRKAFGDHYVYAGLGTVLQLGTQAGQRGERGKSAGLTGKDLELYADYAAVSHDFLDTQVVQAGHQHHLH